MNTMTIKECIEAKKPDINSSEREKLEYLVQQAMIDLEWKSGCGSWDAPEAKAKLESAEQNMREYLLWNQLPRS